MTINNLIIAALCVIGFLIAAGLFNAALIIFKVPSSKTTKAIKSVAKRQKISSDLITNYYNDISLFVSKFVVMSEFKRNKLTENLRIANVAMTPELFIARSLVKSIGTGILAVLAFFIIPNMMFKAIDTVGSTRKLRHFLLRYIVKGILM